MSLRPPIAWKHPDHENHREIGQFIDRKRTQTKRGSAKFAANGSAISKPLLGPPLPRRSRQRKRTRSNVEHEQQREGGEQGHLSNSWSESSMSRRLLSERSASAGSLVTPSRFPPPPAFPFTFAAAAVIASGRDRCLASVCAQGFAAFGDGEPVCLVRGVWSGCGAAR